MLLYAHLTAHRSRDRLIMWLKTMEPTVRDALHAIGTGKTPSWMSLQALRAKIGGEQLFTTCLRARLVQRPLAEMYRIDRLLADMHTRGPISAALTIKQFWQFYLAERVALRCARKFVDPTLESDRWTLKIAFTFLRFVLMRRAMIAHMTQGDVTAWIQQAPRSHVQRLRPFLQWLFAAGMVPHRLSIPAAPISPGTGTPVPMLHMLQRRASRDTTLPLLVRVALLLICKCARYPREIVTLRPGDVRRIGDVLWVRFAHGFAQPLDGSDAQVVMTLCKQRRKRRGRWLFPSKPRPETHMSAHGICGLIRAAGVAVNINQLRNAACRDLLKDFTPSELCEIVGMGPGVAEHWRRRGYSLTRSQKAYVNNVTGTPRPARRTAPARE